MSSPGCEKSAVACAYDFFSEEKVASGHKAEDTRDKADCSEENEDKSSTGRGEGASGGAAASSAKARPRTKSMREQNSGAQKRYRERQKLQRVNLQGELEQLRAEVARLSQTHREHGKLEVRALELDARLQGQQADIVMMQQAVSQEAAESDRQNQGSEPSSRLEHVVLQVSQLQLHWFLSIHRLGTMFASGDVDTEFVARLVAEVQKMFLQLMDSIPKEAGLHFPMGMAQPSLPMWSKCMMQTNINSYASFSSQAQAAKWKELAASLALQPQQVNQLLRMRVTALQELDQILIERKAINTELQLREAKWGLNMQTVHSMEAKLVLLQMSGQEVVVFLDRIKKNLGQEAKVVNFMHTECIEQVLLPSEAIRFMTECNPYAADAVLLANTYAGASVFERA
mmetsp:Transcript_32277/g.62065  ORF Transcript_32277/g.62065 Transcript_32277/m.62065 type:complete len:399 (-) Transcript_32277:498-1694(-)